jgi:hypothetical protein
MVCGRRLPRETGQLAVYGGDDGPEADPITLCNLELMGVHDPLVLPPTGPGAVRKFEPYPTGNRGDDDRSGAP